ncbi:conserved hypothetical protein [Chthoniobacter flavus Ellin428]|uniref:DUF58 domain-containing protein n=1 Tax=Chthoniobacter flavus Ellin428 TaxID=497964 RepID=B4CVT8_9BACT|nr:DUF58 domain-containing protein [Chthoniobacter flavus]EDY21530.1 conserved hypothetical protein [Chthoniobacter flavus Ellin428]TCO95479.1 uncharacterized protein DUF58 [Chthoniobacter flavus]
MSIRNLELRARTVVEGFWHGLHRSPYHGFSVEFTEYRPYTPGDDPRYLDWKLAGRTDRYFIKKFEDETNLRCHLLVDLSRSMTFGSTGYSKADYSRTLAATLAWFLAQQGDATGLLTFDGAMREYLPARHRPGHLRQLMLALEKPAEGRSTDLTAPLRRIVELVRKRGMIVLISDLLAPIDRLASALGLLTASGHEVIIFQVLDPAELNFDFQTAARFEDLETGRDVFLEPAQARANYVRRFSAHLEALRETCQGLGILHVQVSSTHPLETVLFDFLKARADRGKVIRRRAAMT